MNTSAKTRLEAALRDKRAHALFVAILTFATLGVAWLVWWGLVLSKRETTENAYVAGHQVQMVAQVAGTVVSVQADDTQYVRAGQLLAQLDSADATLALDRARAELAKTVRQVRQLRDTAALNEATLTGRQLDLEQADDALQRRLPLLESRAIAPELLADAKHNDAVARTVLVAAQRQAAAARDMAGDGELADHPLVQAARASYADAWLWLQRTRITAPVAGTVAQRAVQAGEHVQAGETLMRIIPADQMWVDANLKEVQLRNLRIGQPAMVKVDLYGGAEFEGRVAGFSPGTGSAFALLPTQNAAGNWVKVVQRVPVRIELKPEDLVKRPLLIGLSAQVRIDTGDRGGARLASSGTTAAEPSAQGQDLQGALQEADQIIAANLSNPENRPKIQ